MKMQNKTIVIAEAGVNHNGSLDIAKNLIRVAAQSGADYVKFQTFKAESLVIDSAKKAEYQFNHGKPFESQLEMLKSLEISEENHIVLIQECKKEKIKFLSTAFDVNSLLFLTKCGQTINKIPSGEITNYFLLREIGKLSSDVILSTGMATFNEIESALDVLERYGTPREKITVLHCVSEYPASLEAINLRVMNKIAERFKVKVGFSDHTCGIEASLAAVAMGATIIEKHFTLDKSLPGPDHAASLDPIELSLLVKSIRNIDIAIGDGIKTISEGEKGNLLISRKSLVASRYIKKGELFSENNLAAKRPASGISPMEFESIILKVANRDYCENEIIDI
jgi:N,N'-diacetyllegionaminate synthase